MPGRSFSPSDSDGLKTHFAAVRRGYVRVFGMTAQALLLTFALAAANLEKLKR
jgi:hypothetical protein